MPQCSNCSTNRAISSWSFGRLRGRLIQVHLCVTCQVPFLELEEATKPGPTRMVVTPVEEILARRPKPRRAPQKPQEPI